MNDSTVIDKQKCQTVRQSRCQVELQIIDIRHPFFDMNIFDIQHRHLDSWPASPTARICLHTRDVFTGAHVREDKKTSSRARACVKTS
jgi:hypothetical protein